MNRLAKAIEGRILSRRAAAALAAKVVAPLSGRIPPGVLFVHQGRCGSTVVASLLDQHPRLSARGELLRPYVASGHLPIPAEHLLLLARARRPRQLTVVEAKFFECQHLALLGATIPELVALAKRAGYRRFIVLDRRNYLRKIVSAQLAQARGGRWHYGVGAEIPATTTTVDIDAVSIHGWEAPIVGAFEYMDEQYRKLRSALSGEDALELSYEDHILEDPQVAYDRICRWLGVGSHPARIQYRRSNARALPDVIDNWDEVVTALSPTPYAWMLEGELEPEEGTSPH